MNEGSIFFVAVLPFPWPPNPTPILHVEHGGSLIDVTATEHGKLHLTITESGTGSVLSFTSQPIVILGDRPRPAQGAAFWNARKCWLSLNRQEILPDAEGVTALTLPGLSGVPTEKSFDHTSAANACKPWIANRQSKFAPRGPRAGRRLKTVQEEAETLRSSILRLRRFRQGVLAGERFLLGTLAGELRAMVYWPKSRDSQPDDQWNPLLLRMANMGALPLPVYSPPTVPAPSIVGQSAIAFSNEAPRISAIFPSDEVWDLQEKLKNTTLRIGAAPGKAIAALELIKEMAHTLGAAHYDMDASDFIDWMQTTSTADRDQLTTFTCMTADAVAELSEWVLSELTIRKVIT